MTHTVPRADLGIGALTIAVDGQTVNLGGGFAPVQTGHVIGCGAADTAWVAN